MREDASVAGASQLPDGDGRMFCLTCFKYYNFVHKDRNRTMIGWGMHTQDRCWYHDNVVQYEEDEKKKKKKEERERRAPKPAWGAEKMRSKVQEDVTNTGLKDPEAKAQQVEVIKASDEEKERAKRDAAGSSKELPKEKKTSKEQKEERKTRSEKKRKADDSSENEKKS